MDTDNEDRPAHPVPLPTPLAAWQSGFDYAFGFPLTLVMMFFGLTPGPGRDKR